MAKKTKKLLVQKEKQIQKSATQKDIAQIIWKELGYTLSIAEIEAVIKLEQSVTVDLLKKGYKLVKKNYLTFTPSIVEKKDFLSALDKKTYAIPKHMSVGITIGDGMKKALVLG